MYNDRIHCYIGGINIINAIVLWPAFFAGAIIYFLLKNDIEKYTSFNIKKNLLFPIFLIIILIIGCVTAQYIHLTESTNRYSNDQQNIQIYFCAIENSGDCSKIVNNINNTNYSLFTSGKMPILLAYIPTSIPDLILNSPLLYFLGGIFIVWFLQFIIQRDNNE